MKLFKLVSLVLCGLALLVFFGHNSSARPPLMDDDPGVGDCLGPEDPFCAGGGSGGVPVNCDECFLTFQTTPMTTICKDVGDGGSGRTTCQITHYPDGTSLCQTSGAFCSVITVTP